MFLSREIDIKLRQNYTKRAYARFCIKVVVLNRSYSTISQPIWKRLTKVLSVQVWIRYQCLGFCKRIILNCGFSTKMLRISTAGKHIGLIRIKKLDKRQYLPHYWSDQCLNGTVVNRTLHGGSLEILLTMDGYIS